MEETMTNVLSIGAFILIVWTLGYITGRYWQ
jgi:hypothetical protein